MPLRELTEQEAAELTTSPDSGLQSRTIAGTEKQKDPFSVDQKDAAGFARRMQIAIEQMEALEDSGFNPVNFGESVIIEDMPFAPDWAENYMKSAKYQQYQRAMKDFVLAQLRRESGAAITAGEFETARGVYAPEPMDKAPAIADKRQARRVAYATMAEQAGKAFDPDGRASPEMRDPSAREALLELYKRAEKNPELKQLLIEKGYYR